jgi:hypothetical protein
VPAGGTVLCGMASALLQLFEVVARAGRGCGAEVWQTSLYLEAVAVACEVVVRAKSGGRT